ncbi:endonuclease domain-containing protein [Microbacterium sp. A93]|uniref:endonuclease domain-containing protein n=1 Tax=unclassified Microbacterium TaxID=2609290 RepID=UPI003F43B360
MDALTALRTLGNVAPVSALRDAGVTAHALKMAKAAGAVRVVRRGWVATADADPLLIYAAKAGVVLSCTTVAKRMGLWVPDTSQTHVAAPPSSGHVTAEDAIVHWNKPIVPRNPHSCEDGIENALIIASTCVNPEHALVLWESALNEGMISQTELLRLPLPARARESLEAARPFSDSGLETIFVRRVRWLNLPLLQQAWILGRPVDLLIGERLVVQIDGGTHVGAQRSADIAHDALLKLHGYHVIRVSYDQIMNRWPEVQALIMAAVAQGLHLAA